MIAWRRRTDAGGHAAEDSHRQRDSQAPQCEINTNTTERGAAVQLHVRVDDAHRPLAQSVAYDAAARAGDASGDERSHQRQTRADGVLSANDAESTEAERVAPEHCGAIFFHAGCSGKFSPQEKRGERRDNGDPQILGLVEPERASALQRAQ